MITIFSSSFHFHIPFFFFFLGIAALVMPLAALPELYGAWPLSNTACDIFICLDMLFCTASILNLAAISLDRFLVITVRKIKSLILKI